MSQEFASIQLTIYVVLNTKHITNTGEVTSTAPWPVITPVAVVSLRDGDDGRLCVPTSSAHHAAQRGHQQQTLRLVGQLTVARHHQLLGGECRRPPHLCMC